LHINIKYYAEKLFCLEKHQKLSSKNDALRPCTCSGIFEVAFILIRR